MNRRVFLTLAVTVALLSVARAEALTAKDLKQFTPISKGISRASGLTVFEGLPHQMFEAAQLKKELATKKTIRLHRFPFYERPLPIAADMIEPLRRLSASTKSYRTYSGPKFCGGFHPDYCLAWSDGDTTYHLLICFNCHEMKLFGPKSNLILDIREDAYEAFKKTLKSYRAQRPSASR